MFAKKTFYDIVIIVKILRRNQMKKKGKKIIGKIFFVILALVLIFIVGMIANNFIILDKNKETNLVINNRNVTANLKNPVLVEENVIYLSEPDVANFFDKYIYDEEESNQIVTTYGKKIAAIGFEENKININGSNKNIYAHAIKKDNVTYLPVSEMADVYDVEVSNIEDTKVVTMDSLNRKQEKGTVNSNLAVKSSTKFIAKTIDRVKKGDDVIIISINDGYARIRTSNGKLGLFL